jgi:hypothetical protein
MLMLFFDQKQHGGYNRLSWFVFVLPSVCARKDAGVFPGDLTDQLKKGRSLPPTYRRSARRCKPRGLGLCGAKSLSDEKARGLPVLLTARFGDMPSAPPLCVALALALQAVRGGGPCGQSGF